MYIEILSNSIGSLSVIDRRFHLFLIITTKGCVLVHYLHIYLNDYSLILSSHSEPCIELSSSRQIYHKSPIATLIAYFGVQPSKLTLDVSS